MNRLDKGSRRGLARRSLPSRARTRALPKMIADDFCPDVDYIPGALTAAYVAQNAAGTWVASNEAPADPPYTYRLQTPCEIDTAAGDDCRSDDDALCPSPPDRVVQVMVIEQQRLVLPDGTTVDGFDPAPGATAREPRSAIGCPWLARAWTSRRSIRRRRRLRCSGTSRRCPLPELTTQQQPPGDGLVGLPVIFYTDSPTTQTFTVDIRGFTVDIVAGATGFTWHTGDGTDLTSTDPGAPYPNQTVTYDYSSGTYTASLTTTWGATFSVDGGASTPVPGTTTTDGPPVTFDVLQARPVLTNPYD